MDATLIATIVTWLEIEGISIAYTRFYINLTFLGYISSLEKSPNTLMLSFHSLSASELVELNGEQSILAKSLSTGVNRNGTYAVRFFNIDDLHEQLIHLIVP